MEKRSLRLRLDGLVRAALAPVDIASIVFFRVVFAGLVIWHVCTYFKNHALAEFWLEPRFLFKYYGFSWVQPWPGNWLYWHWGAVGVFALFVGLGFCYRASALLLFLSYTYFFLLDEARFVNHTYLICLFSFLLVFIPAHRALSVDAWLRPRLRSRTIPAWSVWIMRLQMSVVYFYAGVAKLAPDWLQGEPMRYRFRTELNLPPAAAWLREEWAIYGASYCSLLLDLFIAPLLLWRRTRLPAFCLAALFHLMNASLFPIGIFPWLALAATALFLRPDWPRRLVHFVFPGAAGSATSPSRPPPAQRGEKFVLGLISLYAAIQVLVPLRHWLTPGGIEWNHAEHRFSWRMLLVNHSVRSNFYVTDPNTGKTTLVGARKFLSPRQRAMLAVLPDYAVQFAHYLAGAMPRRGPLPLRVEARILTAINGRVPELYLDPRVDLAAEPRPLLRPAWLRKIQTPLPPVEERYRQTDAFTAEKAGRDDSFKAASAP